MRRQRRSDARAENPFDGGREQITPPRLRPSPANGVGARLDRPLQRRRVVSDDEGASRQRDRALHPGVRVNPVAKGLQCRLVRRQRLRPRRRPVNGGGDYDHRRGKDDSLAH
jgi:hypothetical protein